MKLFFHKHLSFTVTCSISNVNGRINKGSVNNGSIINGSINNGSINKGSINNDIFF